MSLIDLLIYLVLWGLVLYVLWWAIGKIGLPEPFGKIATVILVVITVLVLLGPLLGYVEVPRLGIGIR
jgi:hypothetical protein